MAPPSRGEITQLAAIAPITCQSTAPKPAAAMPAPMTPPTTAWVVETGAPSQVARLTQTEQAISAAIIAHTNVAGSATASGATMPLEMVDTTSPPAMMAPALSNMAAMTSAAVSVMALAPTAGPTLFATSLAPMLSAM